MPLASEAKAPTYSWIQRTSQLTEFAMLKDSVKKLERASREQLLLENESQGAFDHLSAEVATLKDALGTLSQVVDGELASLRDDLKAIREEMRQTVLNARAEATQASETVAEASRSAMALVELSVGQLKENLHRVEEDVREARNQHTDLSTKHHAAIAALSATADAAKQEWNREFDALAERVGKGEAELGEVKAELDQKLRHEHAGLMTWSEEAKTQIKDLRIDVTAVRDVADGAVAQCGNLADDGRKLSSTLEEFGHEGKRHLNAITLLVETVDRSSNESKANAEQLGARVGTLEQQISAAGQAHDVLEQSCRAEEQRLSDGLKQLEASSTSLREETIASKLNLQKQGERLKNVEGDVSNLRREGAEMASTTRALKSGLKDAAEKQKTSEQKVRKQLDQVDHRHEAYDGAFATLSEALKLANPLSAGMSRAAAAL